MKNVIRNMFLNILKLLPTKIVINIENIISYKRFFKKNRANYFGEKIQWMKLYGNLQEYTDYVDKYKVRQIIEKELGEEYLIPLVGVYNNVSEIDYSKLPKAFVIKLNHGSGYNIIVKDKNKINVNKINKRLQKWLREDYYKIKKEIQYKNVNKKIIIEEYMSDSSGELLDYKFFCFNGKSEFVKVDFDRYAHHTANFYDMKWNKLDLTEKGFNNYKGDIDAPKNLSKMIEIAENLSLKFPFVRVDLYNVNGKIYFGELTFTPASGKHPFLPLSKDLEIAKKMTFVK